MPREKGEGLTEKHCNTCNDSFYAMEQDTYMKGDERTQHCRNPIYNSEKYTYKMLLEDWGKGYCRLWTPKIQESEKTI